MNRYMLLTEAFEKMTWKELAMYGMLYSVAALWSNSNRRGRANDSVSPELFSIQKLPVSWDCLVSFFTFS